MKENSNEESLIGGRSHEREDRVIDDVTSDGRQIYEAFLSDPNALVTSKEHIEQAKNAFDIAKIKHPDIIQMCQRESIEKCIEAVSLLKEAA